MPEMQTKQEKIERRTYLKGRLRGQYIGYLNQKDSDLLHEACYDLEILNAEIWVKSTDIQKWDTGDEFEEFTFVEQFGTGLPKEMICHVEYKDSKPRDFIIELREPKLINFRLFDQVYQRDQVLGTIEGGFSGYILHYDFRDLPLAANQEGDNNSSTTGRQSESNRSSQAIEPGDEISFWKTLGEVIQILALVAFAVPLLIAGWPLLVLGALGFGVYLIGAIIQPVIRYVGKSVFSLIWMLFLVIFVLALFNIGTSGHRAEMTPIVATDSPQETTSYVPEDTNGVVDSIIRHNRIWNAYNGQKYSGSYWLRLSDVRKSSAFRNAIAVDLSYLSGYNEVVAECSEFDQAILPGVYAMFDSLRDANKFDDKKFAEALVSFVQDIPYTLILEDICSPWQYKDAFVREYLLGGGKCRPYTKFGLLTPSEFLATLDGDCDTRALLLFTLLSHYGYDVAMLSSEHFSHSVLAANLPYPGVSKLINGRRYVIWETTQLGLQPGIFPNKMSDMRLWSVNLLSTQNQVQ